VSVRVLKVDCVEDAVARLLLQRSESWIFRTDGAKNNGNWKKEFDGTVDLFNRWIEEVVNKLRVLFIGLVLYARCRQFEILRS